MKRACVGLFAAAVWLALSGAGALQAQEPGPDPTVGNPRAAVHLIMYQDLECPKCAMFHKALVATIIPAYGARVAFEFRDFPLTYHPWAFNAALIARYLDTRNARLGMDWRDYCFSHQDEIVPGGLLDQAAALCAPYGISRADLQSAFSRADLYAKIRHDQDLAASDHIQGTPLVLIDGTALSKTASVQDLIDALNAALAKPAR